MKRLKDFFYNTSDIVVVALIVVLAAGLIFWRTDTILNYPAKLVSEAYAANQPKEPITTPYERPNENPNGTNLNGDTTNGSEDGSFVEPEVFALYINSGDSLEVIGNNLVAMGCFETSQEFIQLVTANGLDTKIQMGNHFFAATSTKQEIVEALCKPGM